MKTLYQRHLFILIVCVCCFFIVDRTEATKEETRVAKIKDEYDILLNVLSHNVEWKELPDPKMDSHEKVLSRLWSVVSEWTVACLEKIPNANAAELVRKLNELDSLEATVVQLVEGESAMYVVSANVWERVEKYPSALSGTFFIVTRTGAESFRVAWTIKGIADKHAILKDELGSWSDFCPCNGPLIGEVVKLPSSKAGTPRFYIYAIQATNAGEIPRQISLWEWNGHEATPLLIHTYRATTVTEHVTFDGEYLKITIKEDYTMVWSCDMNCPGAEVVWTLRVTPNGIEDLGRVYTEPDMKLLSNLWDRVLHHEPTDNLASPQVVATIQQVIKETGGGGVIGQGGGEQIISTTPDGSRILCIRADDFDESLFFEIENKHGTPYFSNILVVKDHEHCCWEMNDQAIDDVWKRLKKPGETHP